VVGLAASLTFVSLSAPDLALTQLSVEVVSTVLLLMGLALLPQHSPREIFSLRKLRDALLALAGGAGMSWIAWVVLTRDHESISWYFLEKSMPTWRWLQCGQRDPGGLPGLRHLRRNHRAGHRRHWRAGAHGGHAHAPPGPRPRGPRLDLPQQPLLLRVAANVVLPVALVFTIYIFMRGHNLPGGGFIAGLITAVALVLQFMSMGQARPSACCAPARATLRALDRCRPGHCRPDRRGAFLLGRPFLTSAHGHPHVPLLGELPLATAALFDLGVYLTVVGGTLLTLSVLGSVRARSRRGADPGTPSEHHMSMEFLLATASALSPPVASTCMLRGRTFPVVLGLSLLATRSMCSFS
jgi:multicomponent K+:H+ antiporter subunit A